MVRTWADFAVYSYGVGPRIPVRSSSQAGLLAGSERSGIGGLPHVAGVSRENVRYRVYTAQENLECINIVYLPLFWKRQLVGNGRQRPLNGEWSVVFWREFCGWMISLDIVPV